MVLVTRSDPGEARVSDELQATTAGCADAHRRLGQELESIDNSILRRASRLPGWTVAHVLTHLARNAESHIRMLGAASEGRSVEQYPGGYAQRASDIEAGAHRSASEICDDVRSTATELEATWALTSPAAWRGHGLTQGAEWPCRVLPFHRWREVELHHADLGVGYTHEDWPDGYVDRELSLALKALPERIAGADVRRVLAWVVGRGDQPASLTLAPWQSRREHYHLLPGDLEDLDRRVVTVFRSRLRQEAADTYGPLAQQMVELAQRMPGFGEVKTFTAEDGERVSLVTFATGEDHAAWRAHPEHRVAQRLGRDELYDEYLIQVCRVAAERAFRRDG